MSELEIVSSKETEKREEGASLVEYALLVALIAVVCIAAVSFLGTSASKKFSAVGSAINTSGGAAGFGT